MAVTELSLGDRMEAVRLAFYNQHRRQATAVAQAAPDSEMWVNEVYEDHVIASVGESHYRIGYSEDENGAIQFQAREEWKEVQRVWQNKSLNAFKALSETDDELRVGNYMVLWGSPEQRDLTGLVQKNADGSGGEFFTPETEFESDYTKTGQLLVDWEHGTGIDGAKGPGRDDILGYVDWKTAKKDEKGMFVERVLFRRNKYVKLLETLIKEGLVGNSSEAAQGVKKAANGLIERWPLRRDSLTVMPMEPRMLSQNVLQAVKALAAEEPAFEAYLPKGQDGPEGGAKSGNQADATKKPITVHSPKEKKTMSDEILTKDDVSKMIEASGAEIKGALDEKLGGMVDQLLAGIAKSGALKDAGYVAPDSEADHENSKSFGDFLLAVRNNNAKRLTEVYKTKALAESDGGSGGYLVPTQFEARLLEVAGEESVFDPLAFHLPMAGRKISLPSLDQTGTSSGQSNFLGGVVAGWEGEGGQLSETEPKFKAVELDAHKLGGYTLVSSELNADSAIALEVLLVRLFGMARGWHRDYAFFRGDGVGKPLGILNAPATLAATRAGGGNALDLADVGNMLSKLPANSFDRGVWFMHQTLIPSLLDLKNSGNNAVFITNIGNKPVWQLLGMPIRFTEKLPAAGTAGDAILCDPSMYLVGDRGGLEIASSEHYKFANNQITWRFTDRVDGKPWISKEITLADGSTKVSPFVKLS